MRFDPQSSCSGDNRAVLLAVDVGNTQTHLGAFDGERLVEHWRFQTRAGATGDELAERISGLLGLRGMGLDDVDAVCVSSVVPPLGTEYEQLTERYLDADCLPIGPGVKTGMPIRIDNPLEVGADRLVNAVAAYERFGERLRRRRLRHRDQLRRRLRRGRVPRRGDRPGSRDLARGADRAGRPHPPHRPGRSPRRRSAAPAAPRSSRGSSSASPG